MTILRQLCDVPATSNQHESDVVRRTRNPDVIVRGLSTSGSDSHSPETAQILVLGNEGWEERAVDLTAITAALAGKAAPARDRSLTALVRAKLSDIRQARKRKVPWLQICDVFVDAGIPIDAETIRKLYWRVANEKHPRKN